MDLKVGETYVMNKNEVSVETGRIYVKKGAKVRVETLLRDERVLVQDLSEDKSGDGSWIVDAVALMPLKAEVNTHYITAHQPIEVMQANMTHDELIGFLKGNIIKYACRCGRKDAPLKEAEKIKQYAEWLCVVLSGGTIDPRS